MQFPRWLTWIFLIFFAYVLYQGNFGGGATEPTPVAEPTAKREYRNLSTLADGERWKRALNPDYKAPPDPCAAPAPAEGALGNYAIVEKTGSGSPAQCGDSITVEIAPVNRNGVVGRPTTATLKLGEQSGLDALLVGLRAGEERVLVVTPTARIATLPAVAKGTLQVLRVRRVAEEKPIH